MVVLDHSERQLTAPSHWHTLLLPKVNQTAVAARWALRILQADSSLEEIGQHWLGSSAIHLGAAVPSMTPLTMQVSGDAVTFQSSIWLQPCECTASACRGQSTEVHGLGRRVNYELCFGFDQSPVRKQEPEMKDVSHCLFQLYHKRTNRLEVFNSIPGHDRVVVTF